MVIFGGMILSICMFIGLFVGDVLGKAIGVQGNVGGIGFAMLLLVIAVEYLLKNDKISQKAQDGIYYWRYMYIPLVVAMACRQNVVAALKGGPVAIISGVLVVVILFMLVPLVTKLIPKDKMKSMDEKEEAM